MKTIGLIGGMSWESTALYYRHINRRVAQRLGGLHSARCIVHSLDFAEIAAMQRAGEWARAGSVLADAARALEAAGAGVLGIATNTMHKVAGAVEAAVNVPLLHIADVAGQALRAAGITRTGLLGTRFTMEQDFYRERLARYGIETVVPDAEARTEVDRVIFGELCCGDIREESRARYRAIVDALAADGAQGVLLGCTEICMLIDSGDVSLPLFDTTALHADALVEAAFARETAPIAALAT
ncbi:MAG TPA: aspartate/glutamate racemase family protein [Mizugakiibacter sp.]